jgi:hypothetical protein
MPQLCLFGAPVELWVKPRGRVGPSTERGGGRATPPQFQACATSGRSRGARVDGRGGASQVRAPREKSLRRRHFRARRARCVVAARGHARDPTRADFTHKSRGDPPFRVSVDSLSATPRPRPVGELGCRGLQRTGHPAQIAARGACLTVGRFRRARVLPRHPEDPLARLLQPSAVRRSFELAYRSAGCGILSTSARPAHGA